MGRTMNLFFDTNNSSVYNIHEVNSSFASGSLKVMYLGTNRNGSSFSKNAVERALPSLKNVPIVCHWNYESNEIGGHDIELVCDDGNLRIRNLTEPCGVVPDHASFSFVTEADEDGNEHEYLIIDGILLWKRQDVFKHIANDLGGKVKHSMEITVKDGVSTESGIYEVRDFEFTALCLLENCDPCFQGSRLELFSATNFKQKMEEMMSELKDALTLVNASLEDDNTHPQNYSMEGGETVLNEKMELVAKYGFEINDLDFSIEELTIEELTEKFEAMKNAAISDQTISAADPSAQDTFALTSNIVEELRRILEENKVDCEWGSRSLYWYVDCDLDVNEVYCWNTNDWLLYGFSYVVNGDSVTVNFESKKRMKYIIVDFDEGEQASPFAPTFTRLQEKVVEGSEWESKYNTASDTIMSMEKELSELRQFRIDTENAIAESERKEVFAQFEDLFGVEDFELLREESMKYDVDTLIEKCYAIRGKNGTTTKFALDNKAPKIKIEKTELPTEPYGGLFVKYGM